MFLSGVRVMDKALFLIGYFWMTGLFVLDAFNRISGDQFSKGAIIAIALMVMGIGGKVFYEK